LTCGAQHLRLKTQHLQRAAATCLLQLFEPLRLLSGRRQLALQLVSRCTARLGRLAKGGNLFADRLQLLLELEEFGLPFLLAP
jgi:hypothetical protein